MPRTSHVLPCLILATGLAMPSSSNAEGIEWTIAPYFWVADVGLDASINGDPVLGVDVPFSDLVDKLDAAFMIHVEARGPVFGAYLDHITMTLSDLSSTPIGPGGPLLGDLTTDTKLEMNLTEIAGTYRWGNASPGSTAVDAIVGIRHNDISQKLRITLPGPGSTQIDRGIEISEFDFMLGGRVLGHFNESWTWKVRGDYSFGGTEGTVNLLGTVGWKFGAAKQFALEGGYRHLTTEFADNLGSGVRSKSELSISGPIFGFLWAF